MNSLESFENINHEYSSILKFVNQFNNITYSQFNDHILKDINLFDVPSEDFFDNINETIDIKSFLKSKYSFDTWSNFIITFLLSITVYLSYNTSGILLRKRL